MKEIILKTGGVTVVDDDVFDRFRHINWSRLSESKPYVRGWFKELQRSQYLHRLIMNPPDGMVVDHIDRNPLNNMRSNLRVVSKADDLRNRIKYSCPAGRLKDDEPKYRATHLAEVIENQGRVKSWIADGIGVSRAQISHVLAGDRLLPESDAKTLADMLSVPLFLIFELADASISLANDEASGRAA